MCDNLFKRDDIRALTGGQIIVICAQNGFGHSPAPTTLLKQWLPRETSRVRRRDWGLSEDFKKLRKGKRSDEPQRRAKLFLRFLLIFLRFFLKIPEREQAERARDQKRTTARESQELDESQRELQDCQKARKDKQKTSPAPQMRVQPSTPPEN